MGTDCVQALCEKFDCGAPSSILDENGCYRAECTSNADCADGQSCRTVTYSTPSCGYAPGDTTCNCGDLANYAFMHLCVP